MAVIGPKRFPVRVAAARLMTSNSKAAQPKSWITFRAVGTYDPSRPRIGRKLTIVGTPARLPWWAAAASMRLPMTDPAMATAADSHSVRPNPFDPTPTRSVPAAKTRSPAPRLDQSTKRSKARRLRSDSGTGSTPHSGGRRRRAIARPSPPGIYRVGGTRAPSDQRSSLANFLWECRRAVTRGSSFPARKLIKAPPPVLT